jgi:tetratricopeptide (TPR) repeat protein
MKRPQPRYQPGDRIGGRYQVYKALMGGMGEIYLCLDLEQNYPYALKTFQHHHLDGSPRLRLAFGNEAATWVALEKHPNIVRCFMLEVLDNQPFLLLEWIGSDGSQGTDLRSWMQRGPLDVKLALDFTIDICRGLVHANEKQPGIVHRDLKPDNVLVAQGPLAKITDFGLAQIIQRSGMEIVANGEGESNKRQSLVGQNGIVGTPSYMAPEQWRGELLDARTDIYAVGCIIYELLTGEPPFHANALDELRCLHLEGELLNLVAHPTTREISDALDALLSSCLAKEREKRPASASDLLQQLTDIYQQLFSQPPQPVLIRDGFSAQDYMNRGVTYERLHRYEESLADHNRALELNSKEALIYNNRGNTLSKLQRYSEALADHNRAVELDPTAARGYSNRGLSYHNLGCFDMALADFDQAIQLDPAYALAYLNRGATYESLKRYNEALLDTTHAIQINPMLAQAYFNRGSAYSALQKLDRALQDYACAIQLDPAHTHALFNRGCLYAKLGRDADAIADYSRAIQFEPNASEFFYNRGNALARLGQHAEAVDNFTRVIALSPSDVRAYYNRGIAYEQMRNYQDALASYTQAVQIEPKYTDVYFNRGNVYLALQRHDEAIADYTHTIELDPTHVSALVNIGVIYYQQDQWQKALPFFEKAAKMGDQEAVDYAMRARHALIMTASEPDKMIIDVFLDALFQTRSYGELKEKVAEYPFIFTHQDLISHVAEFFSQTIPPELRPEFEQRMSWLHHIIYSTL